MTPSAMHDEREDMGLDKWKWSLMGAFVLLPLLAHTMVVWGHVDLDPRQSIPKKWELYTLNVPTETTAPTVAVPTDASQPATQVAGQPPHSDGGGEQDLVPIHCPMVGTFYAASSPDAKPFVSVGDRVDAETLVCIIEAMKVFNEIKAETAGVIQKVMVENGQAVEFDQPLFLVRGGADV